VSPFAQRSRFPLHDGSTPRRDATTTDTMTRTERRRLSINSRSVSPLELDYLVPDLTGLLADSVSRGASLGFMAPLAYRESQTYWRSLVPELQAGSRLLLAAFVQGQLLGSGQLAFPAWPNARHRVEIQKLFVAAEVRGRGIGRSLMTALHDAARQRGRSLVVLGTRRGEPAEKFYKRLGYLEAGVIPGYTTGPSGERHDNITLYRQLPM